MSSTVPNGKTLSLIAGTTICNARCPFCISKTTPFVGMTPIAEKINKDMLINVCNKAQELKISTVLITGKGEPTIQHEHVSQYLKLIRQFGFSHIELQTNAILFGTKAEKYDDILRQWKMLGLETVAISVVHYDRAKNAEVYTPGRDYFDLDGVIGKLHSFGFKVRLSCTMLKGYIDRVSHAKEMIDFAMHHDVEQLTLRRMEAVENSENPAVSEWTTKRIVGQDVASKIRKFLQDGGQLVATFFYGAEVFEFGLSRQNVCLTNGLTDNDQRSDIRQLIFFPSGKVITDWRYDTSDAKEVDVIGLSKVKK